MKEEDQERRGPGGDGGGRGGRERDGDTVAKETAEVGAGGKMAKRGPLEEGEVHLATGKKEEDREVDDTGASGCQ